MAMQVPIGFDWQSTNACGKYSLQHALLLLGVPITQRDADGLTRVPRWRHIKESIMPPPPSSPLSVADDPSHEPASPLRQPGRCLTSAGSMRPGASNARPSAGEAPGPRAVTA